MLDMASRDGASKRWIRRLGNTRAALNLWATEKFCTPTGNGTLILVMPSPQASELSE